MHDNHDDYRFMYIDDKYHEGVDTFEVKDPTTGETIATVAEAGEKGGDEALTVSTAGPT